MAVTDFNAYSFLELLTRSYEESQKGNTKSIVRFIVSTTLGIKIGQLAVLKKLIPHDSICILFNDAKYYPIDKYGCVIDIPETKAESIIKEICNRSMHLMREDFLKKHGE